MGVGRFAIDLLVDVTHGECQPRHLELVDGREAVLPGRELADDVIAGGRGGEGLVYESRRHAVRRRLCSRPRRCRPATPNARGSGGSASARVGPLLADNLFLGGAVLGASAEDSTVGIREFARRVQHDEEMHNVLLTIGDGVMLAWRRPEDGR